MQVKKNEMREDILYAAEEEFFYHGYNNASLRKIAKKANTTLGNLYHYFSSKEAMLEEVLVDYPDRVMELILSHHDHVEFIPKEEITYATLVDIKEYLDNHAVENFHMDIFADKKIVILLQGCGGTKYEHYNEEIRGKLRENMGLHYKVGKDSLYLLNLVDSVVDTVIGIVKKNKNRDIAIKLVLEYITLICLGMMCQIMFENGVDKT